MSTSEERIEASYPRRIPFCNITIESIQSIEAVGHTRHQTRIPVWHGAITAIIRRSPCRALAIYRSFPIASVNVGFETRIWYALSTCARARWREKGHTKSNGRILRFGHLPRATSSKFRFKKKSSSGRNKQKTECEMK